MKTLLPRSFKIVGYLIPLLVIAVLIIIKFIDPTITKGNDAAKNISLTLLAIGLLIVILSKDKNEDERIDRLRMKAISWAFIFGIMYTLLGTIFPMENDLTQKSSGLIFFVEASYLVYFEILKRTS